MIEDMATTSLTSSTQSDEAGIRVTLRGRADTPAKPALSAYLARLDELTRSRKLEEVVVDVRSLDFMTSSCVNALVVWIGRILDAPAEERYRIVFESDAKKHWQPRTFAALASFGCEVIRVAA